MLADLWGLVGSFPQRAAEQGSGLQIWESGDCVVGIVLLDPFVRYVGSDYPWYETLGTSV